MEHPINIRLEIVGLDKVVNAIERQNRRLDKIMATQQEIIAQMEAQSAEIQKIGSETRTLIEKIQALIDQINQGEVTPELAAACQAVTDQLQIVDELVPDAPPEGQPTPTPNT